MLAWGTGAQGRVSGAAKLLVQTGPKEENVTETGRLGLGPVDQVSYVVEDLERALPRYQALYGPFEVGVAPLRECTIHGAVTDCTLRVAVNRSGPLEIELIQVLDGSTPHSEHLRTHGEGLHHVRFRVEGLERKLAELEREGYTTVFHKRFGPTLAFAYLETPREIGGSLIELLEMPGSV
jgi:4-hydroxyphenylpyruvate dioxygenase-like putative hemolysin